MNPNSLRVGHLIMGLVFLALTSLWALYVSGGIDAHSLRWLVPLPLLIGGGVSLAALAISGRRRAD